MKIAVQFKCPSCEKAFADDGSFESYYHCENCSEYWPKDDGRNCPQCNKFGRNPEMPICPECSQEVEEYMAEVDPDQMDVIDANGNEIVSKKKERMRQITQQKNEERQQKEKELRQIREQTLIDECMKRDIKQTVYGDRVIASKVITILGQVITLRAQVSIGFPYGDKLPPFHLRFRLTVAADQSGWEGDLVQGEEFEDINALFSRAEEMMAEPFSIS